MFRWARLPAIPEGHGAGAWGFLRAKIYERVGAARGMFKDVKVLSDLFRKDVDNEISNIKQLLELCSKAEMLEMEYDTKFKLRYLISNVLLYGKNDLE